MHETNPLITSSKIAESPTSKNEMRWLEGETNVDGRTAIVSTVEVVI